MLKVVAEHIIKEDCLEKFKELSKIIVEKTVALDQGCISYAVCQDINNPLHCSMIEEWESQQMLDKHMQAAHFIEIVPKIGECCEGAMVITLYNKLF